MNGSRLLILVALLQIAILGIQGSQWLANRESAPDEEEESTLEELMTELREDVSVARYELSNEANRLRRLLDQLAAGGSIGGGGPGGPDTSLPNSPNLDLSEISARDLLFRLFEVNELHRQFKLDPIQRVPVEKERARIEAELRKRGDASIDALDVRFKEVPDTQEQTRLLTQIVAEVETERALEFAYAVFRDQGISSGVRLVGANIAREAHAEEIDKALVNLLVDPDAAFARREQIIYFFKENHYPPAAAALAELAVDLEVARYIRRFALQALAKYPEPVVIDSLKQVASEATQGDLRAEALRSLSTILGREVLDFLQFIRGRLNDDDPLLRLVEDLELEHGG